MSTRIENSRTAKRTQATVVWDTSDAAFVTATGRIPRLDPKGFPASNGADTTRVAYTAQA